MVLVLTLVRSIIEGVMLAEASSQYLLVFLLLPWFFGCVSLFGCVRAVLLEEELFVAGVKKLEKRCADSCGRIDELCFRMLLS